MRLVDHYLRAVRMYLPKAEQDDIVNELNDNLLSMLEDRAAELGRPLTEPEQEAILLEHGRPLVVAGRYGAKPLGVAFGIELISPEFFPIYIRILLFIFALDLLVIPTVSFLAGGPALTVWRFLVPMAVQFAIVTACWIIASRSRHRRPWNFPPAYLQMVPVWQSTTGLIFWLTFTTWWIAVFRIPALALGSNADHLALSTTWNDSYWPVLVLAFASIAQRSITLVRPDLNWLQPVTRLATSSFGLVLIGFLLRSQPYVVPSAAALDLDRAIQLAHRVDNGLWWNLAASLGIYVAITAAFNAWLCLEHLRYRRRRRSAFAGA
jgi:hypothetical protein